MHPNGGHDGRGHAAYVALAVTDIQNAIDSACKRASKELADGSSDSNSGRWVWDRWNTKDQERRSLSLLHGFIGTKDDLTHDLRRVAVCTVTFYFAYSTWDGRILYIDNLMNADDDASTTYTVYRILADIATQLYCRR
jgi:hypothetical protein